MATKERLLRLSLAHYRRDTCSEADCHYFLAASHAKQAATLHASHGAQFYYQYFATDATRQALEGFRREMGANWVIDQHDITVELYLRDMATLKNIASDAAFANFAVLEEPYISRKHVVASLGWVEVYVQNGEVVGIDRDGKPTYPPYADFVKEGGQLSDLLHL